MIRRAHDSLDINLEFMEFSKGMGGIRARMVPISALLLLLGCVARTTYDQDEKCDQEAEQAKTLGIQLKDCQEQNKQLQAEVQADQEQIKKLGNQEADLTSTLSSQDKIC